MSIRRALAPAAACAALLALAGCSSPGPVPTAPVTSYPGEPKGVDAPDYSAGGVPFAVWLDGGDRFAVTLYGTDDCPARVAKYRVDAPDEVVLTVAGDCPLEYLPYTTVFATPPTVDRRVTIRFTAQGMNFYLPPVAGGDGK